MQNGHSPRIASCSYEKYKRRTESPALQEAWPMKGSWELTLRGLTDLPWRPARPRGAARLVDSEPGSWGNLFGQDSKERRSLWKSLRGAWRALVVELRTGPKAPGSSGDGAAFQGPPGGGDQLLPQKEPLPMMYKGPWVKASFWRAFSAMRRERGRELF